jgi:transposase
MVDIKTHKIIDMLESREREDVAKWLSKFPNIQVVSRDGSRTYRNAINNAFENAIQISDRFHIVKNLIKASKRALNKRCDGRIPIPMTDKTKELKYKYFILASKREKILIIKQLRKEGKKIK